MIEKQAEHAKASSSDNNAQETSAEQLWQRKLHNTWLRLWASSDGSMDAYEKTAQPLVYSVKPLIAEEQSFHLGCGLFEYL
jgi:hypothetical protein